MPGRISIEELQRIESMVAKPEKKDTDRRREEKKALSDKRRQRWPNTLQALRAKKENAHKERAQALEAKRREIDRQEDERKAKERRDKIEYAAKIMYRQTDKMKRLASAELFAECIEARKRQIEFDAKLKEHEKTWEEQFLEMEKQRNAQMKAREDEEMEQRNRIAKEIAKTQKEQLEEVKQARLETLQREQQEGKEIAQRARQEQDEDKKKRLERQRIAKENAIQTQQANLEARKIKAEQQELEAEEDRKTEAFAKAKEEQKARQRKQQERLEAIKQKRRQDMIDEGIRRLALFESNNEQRLNNQVAQARRQEDEKERMKQEKRDRYARQMHESRQSQIEFKQMEKERQRQLDEEFATRWKAHNQDMDESEALEHGREKQAAKQHQRILLNQAMEKRERELNERRREIYEAKTLENQADDEIEEFKRVASERLKAIEAAGLNSYPLKKCIADVTQKQSLAP